MLRGCAWIGLWLLGACGSGRADRLPAAAAEAPPASPGSHRDVAAPRDGGAKLVPQYGLGEMPFITHLRFSPDGRRVVTASENLVALWHPARGLLVHLLRHPDLAFVQEVAWVPGGRLLTATDEGAFLWDAVRGTPLDVVSPGVPLGAAAVAADGEQLALGRVDGGLELHEMPPDRGVTPVDAHTAAVTALDYAADGRRLVSASEDGTAAVWDARDGTLVARLTGHEGAVTDAFFADRSGVVTVGEDGSVRLWSVSRQAEIRRFGSDAIGARRSGDGSRLATDVRDGTGATIWDVATGEVVSQPARSRLHMLEVAPAAFSRDGSRVVAALNDGEGGGIGLFDAASGALEQRLEARADRVRHAVWSPDDRYVAALDSDLGVTVWDLKDGSSRALTRQTTRIRDARLTRSGLVTVARGDAAELLILRGHRTSGVRVLTDPEAVIDEVAYRGGRIDTVAAFPDGEHLAWATRDFVTLWHADDPAPLHRLRGPTPEEGARTTLAVSADGGTLAVAPEHEPVVYLWDPTSGALRRRLEVDEELGFSLALSPDGRRLLTYHHPLPGEVAVYDTTTGARLHRFPHPIDPPDRAAFSDDGSHLVTENVRLGVARVWEVATGEPLHTFAQVRSGFALSPDHRFAVTGGTRVDPEQGDLEDPALQPRPLAVWDLATGERLRELPREGRAPRYSPDGTWIAALAGSRVQLAHATDPSRTHTLEGLTGWTRELAFTPDSRRLVTTSGDGLVSVWEVETGSLLVSTMTFRDGTWAAVDPHGRYDASYDGDIDGLVWVIDGELYELSQLESRYYDPGLLAKALGFSDEPLRPVPPLSSVRPPARIHLEGPSPSGALELQLEDRGGGIGTLFVTLNGNDISEPLRTGCPALPRGARCTYDLSSLPWWLTGTRNVVDAVVGDRHDRVRSPKGLERIEVEAEGPVLDREPELWVLAVGVDDYVGDRIDLSFAAKDARTFAEALSVAGAAGFAEAHVRVLSTADRDDDGVHARPSREALEDALGWLGRAHPLDTVVLFLSGHGTTVSDGTVDDYFYLLPAAASLDDAKDPDLRPSRTWSGSELADALARLPALKRVVILDTCAAGKVGGHDLAATRDLSGDAVRAHVRARDRTGAWLLAGAAADRVSYEATRFGQGVLTYTLLQGMRGPALDESDLLWVDRLFGYAEDHVPRNAEGIGGIQTPVLRRGAAQFPMGRLPPELRAQVPIRSTLPVVVDALITGSGGRSDPCELRGPLNAALRDVAAAPDPPFVKWRTGPRDDKWEVTGICQQGADGLRFQGFATRFRGVERDEHRLGARGASPEELAAALAQQITEVVTSPPR